MSAREVIFLGTSSQVPTRSRGHNAFFVRWDDLGILFDPGDGTQRQMIHAGLAASQITHIAITHFHGDHCLGLAGIIQRISLDRVPHTIPVLFPKSGAAFFERLRSSSIFHDVSHLAPTPIVAPRGDLAECARTPNVVFYASALEHGVDCHGYRIEEPDGRRMLPERLQAAGVRGPDIGKLVKQGSVVIGDKTVRIEDVSEHRKGQSLAVVMDTRPCAGASILARGVDLLVSEATYLSSDEVDAHDHGHMTAVDAATIAHDSGVRRLVLTHFSQRYTSTDAFGVEARAIHPDTVVAADLDVVPVPPRA